ncbi:LuxR C-terminal-related transcriptional regulator [Streptomyces ziwulingensis]|uniref:Helix-turn-helix transcriptional regulator n=1 Tax=Streptomyces ziwulingensis TaxID=1045501 RepID=A0ABP9CJB0_9ACTN
MTTVTATTSHPTLLDRDPAAPDRPWPFTGREDELERVRRSLAAGRPGLVVTGPSGVGKTRLVTEALRATDHARAVGTPETRHLPFAAFAGLLPEPVTLHRAVHLLSGVRLLLVDDAHLLDDASAALVHQLAAHGRVRLLVVTADGAPVPEAVSRLWTGELLPRLALGALPREESADLLTAAVGTAPEPLTADRLHRLCRGDLRLLRELLGAVRDHRPLTADPETGEWSWCGPVPVTAALRERAAPALDRARPGEREALERLAFAEPLPLDLDDLDTDVLERLEADGLIDVDDRGGIRLAHPLHGPVLRAATGRLRARRLARDPAEYGPALAAETAALAHRAASADVRPAPAPVGEWLVARGTPPPAPDAAVRARLARLRGHLREAAAWAREGLRSTPGDPSCRTELALAAAQCGDPVPDRADAASAAVWSAAARGDLTAALAAVADDPYDAVRLGAPERAAGRLTGVFAAHADALGRGDGPALDRAAAALERRGFLLYAAEAHAQAVRIHRDPGRARTARTRAVALARRCPGARTPALTGLVLGELTARQRQIVTLAAAGMSNRQIAERLTLSVRTVGNHLYGAYTRLGSGDRAALPWLTDQPEPQPA